MRNTTTKLTNGVENIPKTLYTLNISQILDNV